MMASGYQLEVSRGIYKQDSLEEEIDVTDDEKEETRRVLYDYVFRRAEGDNILTRHQTDSFREAHLKSNDGCEYIMWRFNQYLSLTVLGLQCTFLINETAKFNC